jgi:hypothetical protein
MPFSQTQLTTWAKPGASTTSASTYQSIRNALLATNSPLRNRQLDIFLQGSYGNSTNIHGDSDVDIVVLYRDTFYKDMRKLTPAQQELHKQLFSPATYQWSNLRDDVVAALRAQFGSQAVTLGTKAIKVQAGSGRMTADVLPAVQFRRYATFASRDNYTAHFGIQFFDSAGNATVNYPKNHMERGEAKNKDERTRGQYKPTIRVFKNYRNYLVAQRLLAQNIAPSYFLECLLHNAPDNLFVGNYTETVPAIINRLLNTPYERLLCQNGVTELFGSESTQWSVVNCATFLDVAQRTWAAS